MCFNSYTKISINKNNNLALEANGILGRGFSIIKFGLLFMLKFLERFW
jgi:hypothetical protein